MKRRWTKLARLGPIGLALWMSGMAHAQDQPQASTASPQFAGEGASVPGQAAGSNAAPSSQGPGGEIGPGVLPSTQSPIAPTPTSRRAAVARLRNPFQGEAHLLEQGLFGLIAPRPSPQYPGLPAAAPGEGAPPGALPGEMAAPGPAPGAGVTPGAEAAPGAEAPPGMPSVLEAPAPPGGGVFAEAAGAAGPGFGGGLGAASEAFPMIGDQGPMFLRQNLRFPPIPPPLPPGVPRAGNNPFAAAGRSVAAIVPAIRGIKISDNQFPRPVDRIFFSFNYYDGVNQGINNEFKTPIKDMQVYHEVFGFEKTFLDQRASFGFRLPLNTLGIISGFPGIGGSSTSLGNLDSFLKYAVYDDGRNFLSVGLALDYPTGPKSFAGYPNLLGLNPFEIQPFMGYIIQRDRVYLQGFNSIAVPTDARAATMYYCDIGLGYFVYRSQNPRSLISFIVPIFETHLNIPLNWVGFQPRYIGGTPDVVDLTFGLNVGMSNKAILSAAYVRPVTGPLPFNGEFALMLNIPFGRGAARAAAFTTPPVIGQ